MSQPSVPCDISIVLVALVGGRTLGECLRRLAPWHGRCQVILGNDMGEIATWQTDYPTVEFSDGRGLTVPLRRRRGIECARGEVVALLEDTSLPEPGWLEAACHAFKSSNVAAAAGPVRIAPELPARFQSLACTEYGRFHPSRFPRLALTVPDGTGVQAVSRLPGNNLAYRRELLLEVLNGSQHGLVEGEVNQRLMERGFRLALQPRMVVTYSACDRHGARLGVRMRHGRLFGGHRAIGSSLAARLAMFTGSLLLPAILTARAIAAMTSAVRPAAWLRVAPWICVMETAWAIGESTGYLLGSGASMEAWR